MSSLSRRRSPKHPRVRRVPPALLLLVPLLLGSASQPAIRPHPQAPVVGKSDRNTLLFAEAAAAARRDDCAGAYKTLAPLTAGKGTEAGFARLVTGFYAHTCEQVGQAEERLFASQDPDGLLEDWRLYILSDAAEARGHTLVAQASLAKLLGDYPASPLRPLALAKAAELAWKHKDAQRALALVAQARREKVDGPEATRLEKLAWEIGIDLGDEQGGGQGGDGIRREAARHLLADSPTEAAELGVAEIFRTADGELPWAAILTPDQLKRRSRSLLDIKLDASALVVLDAADVRDRDLDWALLKAEALTRINEGAAALELLSNRTVGGAGQTAALEWARAQAAAEVATARRGRTMPSAERQQYLEQSRRHLRKVGQLAAAGGDPDLGAKALRSLYKDLADDDFEGSIEVLRQLRRIEPADTTGADHLWQRGWREYGRRNFSGAVGYWTELFALYPEASAGRRGRYWTGRAFEALGETERAQQIYREVASSDTTDFYRKNALTRVRGKVPSPSMDERGAEPWPDDPALQRARLLTDLGLEDLAAVEMELVSEQADERAKKALEALVQSRQGERRKSMLTIREAFPALGGSHQATLPEEARRLYYPVDYQDTIRSWATQNRLPLHVVYGIIRQESAFDTQAQSWAGARGLMQLMPATARELAGKAGLTYSHEKLSDPAFNVRLGTTYFSQVMNMFDHVELALAGYNGGPYRIKRLWKEAGSKELDSFLEGLNIEESKIYVKRVLVLSDSYRQLYPLPG